MTGIRSLAGKAQPLIDDFPTSARTALAYVFTDIYDKGYLISKSDAVLELNRLGRFTVEDTEEFKGVNFLNSIAGRLNKLSWLEVLSFCERAHEKLLHDDWLPEYKETLEQPKEYFTREVNLILEEENINFIFINGFFSRRGKVQTRNAIDGVGFVLSDEKMTPVKRLFNKARKAFDQRPSPDVENCVKDALCALEAAIEILTGKDSLKDFDKTINQLKGNRERQIPAPIAEAMIKIHSYRGSAQGVGHAAIGGNRVSPVEAEFVLSIVATYITYLYSLFPKEEEIPF